MKITISEELREHLASKKRNNIVVDVATSDTSDFDVTEIFIRTCDGKHREYLKNKLGFREFSIEGEDLEKQAVLIKPYRMHIGPEVHFDLKKVWIFKKIVFEGIKL